MSLHFLRKGVTALLCLSAMYKIADAQALKQQYTTSNEPSFEENRGQIQSPEGDERSDILYVYKNNGIKIFFTRHGWSIQLEQDEYTKNANGKDSLVSVYTSRTDVVSQGANPAVEITTGQELGTYNNYYTGKGLAEDILHVKQYKSLLYKNLWKNIDIEWIAQEGGQIKYNIIVHPGGDIKDVQLQYNGALPAQIQDGKLVVTNPVVGPFEEAASFTESIPESYLAASRKPVQVSFGLEGNTVSYQLKDSQQVVNDDLLIDPIVKWGTYFGGNNNEGVSSITANDSGDVYLCGYTLSSSGIATTGAFQTSYNNNYDIFFAKFSVTGQRLWSTYYGNSDTDFPIIGKSDSYGNYILGSQTYSKSMVPSNAYQSTKTNSNKTILLASFAADGSRNWATYFSGQATDIISSLTIDTADNIIISGNGSKNIPVTKNAYDTTGYGGFLSKFNNQGSLIWSTIYSCFDSIYSGDNDMKDVASDKEGNIYVFASTYDKSGYYATPGAIKTSNNLKPKLQGSKAGDVIISKFDPNGFPIWSTYFGGSEDEYANSISCDNSGNIYCYGSTTSDSGISTKGAFNTVINNGNSTSKKDLFVLKMDTSGKVKWCTYIGGGDDETLPSVNRNGQLDAGGNFLISGISYSTDNMVHGSAPYSSILNGNFIASIMPNGGMNWSSYLPIYSIEYTSFAKDGNYYYALSDHQANIAGVGTPNTYQPTAPNTNYNNCVIMVFGDSVTAQKPLTASRNLSIYNIRPYSVMSSVTPGTGYKRMWVLSEKGPIRSLPKDGRIYKADSTFGKGDTLGTGEYVACNDISNSTAIYGLKKGTWYYISAFEYNKYRNQPYYANADLASDSFQTIIDSLEPTIPSSNPRILYRSDNEMTIKVDKGNGAKRLVVARYIGTPFTTPVDFEYYKPDPFLEKGDTIGGIYSSCIYADTGDIFTLKSAYSQKCKLFIIEVFEYNGDSFSANYLTSKYLIDTFSFVGYLPPSVPDKLEFSSVTDTSLQVSWLVSKRLQILSIGEDSADIIFQDGKGYFNPNTIYGKGDTIEGPRSSLIYKDYNQTSTNISGLKPATKYHICLATYASDLTCANYQDDLTYATVYTLARKPTDGPDSIKLLQVDDTTARITVFGGNNDRRLILAREKNIPAIYSFPDRITYQPNHTFGLGESPGTTLAYTIYSDTGRTITITGLQPNTTYGIAAYGYNGDSASARYYNDFAPTLTFTTREIQPRKPATDLTFSNVTTNSMIVSCTPGDGQRRIFVVHRQDSVKAEPLDGKVYLGTGSYGSGSNLGDSSFVVASGSASSFQLKNLQPNTQYSFAVYEYNGNTNTNYLQSPALRGAHSTLDVEPAYVNMQYSFSQLSDTAVKVSLHGGNGVKRLLVVSEDHDVSKLPGDGTIYSTDSRYGKGDDLGANQNFCLTQGMDSVVYLSGLKPNTTYHFATFMYSGDSTSTNYLTSNYAKASVHTLDKAPDVSATGLYFKNITPASFTAVCSRGNGAARLFVLYDAPISSRAVNGKKYAASAIYASGDTLGNAAAYTVLNGDDSLVTVTGLKADTKYYMAIIEYNGANGAEHYQTGTYLQGHVSTLAAEPLKMSSQLKFTDITASSFTLSCDAGDGQGRLFAIRRAFSIGNGLPQDGKTYTPGSIYAMGDTLSKAIDSIFVFYTGPGNSATITGLDSGTTYFVSVTEYNGNKQSLNYASQSLMGDVVTSLPSGISETAPWGNITVYPSPVSASASLHLSDLPQERLSISITDISGRELALHNITTGSQKINLPLPQNISPGMYLLKINNAKGAYYNYKFTVVE